MVIFLISAKYNRLTFSTAIGVAINKKSPVYRRPDTIGFVSPPNPTAISISEDWSFLSVSVPPWSPFDSLDALSPDLGHPVTTERRP